MDEQEARALARTIKQEAPSATVDVRSNGNSQSYYVDVVPQKYRFAIRSVEQWQERRSLVRGENGSQIGGCILAIGGE